MTGKKRSRRHSSCYMCSKRATSREHVPPLCFFPEEDEFPGAANLRTNLITVPACDEHNLAKSTDDQYLCTVLAIHFENNSLAQAHFSKKILRALKRRPAMIPGFFKNLAPATVRGSQSGAFGVDRSRFDRALTHIARGVHFRHFKDKYTGHADVISYSIFDVSSPNKDSVNRTLQEWRRYSDAFLAEKPKYGNNPSVFYYQLLDDPIAQKVAIRLVFYEGFVADVYFADAQPRSPSAA